ncbi:MAG: hypothetical protein GXO36_06635, partial [Chloroflexi bacterium]|nr:hypothetical protein [Chloroflexota bacterium]
MDANQWKALKAASLAAFLQAAKAVPGVSQVLAPLHTAVQTYRETLAGLDDLPTHTRRA